MNQAIVVRINPWLVVAMVVVLLMLIAALLTPTAWHAISGLLHSPAVHADQCSGSQAPC